jgi:hypothetical protein
VTSIGSNFSGCENLTSITVSPHNRRYSDIVGVLFNKTQKELIQYPAKKSQTDYIIPKGVTNIGEWAFSGCKNLRSIVIPESVTSIGGWAFHECKSLKNIEVKWNTPIKIDTKIFDEEDITLHVPEGAAKAYCEHEVWGKLILVNSFLVNSE